jgi:predicted metal-dependent hydrolase
VGVIVDTARANVVAGAPVPAGYRAFFDHFNAGCFFAAHAALETEWLPRRGGPEGDFFKGLIQLAGAFVHIEKGRAGPATALLRLARARLARYPAGHLGLDSTGADRLIATWLNRLEGGEAHNATPAAGGWPRLQCWLD